VAPDFGAQEDGGERAGRRYRNRMKDLSPKGGDKVGECLSEVLAVGDET
jgi:hypothetical protein